MEGRKDRRKEGTDPVTKLCRWWTPLKRLRSCFKAPKNLRRRRPLKEERKEGREGGREEGRNRTEGSGEKGRKEGKERR